MSAKEILGLLAVAIGMAGQGYYMWLVFRRSVKPHIFSWIIWGLLGLIGFSAQYAADAGPGSWSLGVSSVICFFIVIAGLFHGEKSITRGDWICFISLLTAIPVWIMTKNPLWAVVIVCVIDAGAFYPTFRKSWSRPHDEGAMAFFTYALQMLVSLFALEIYNLTTALYTVVLLIMNAALTATLVYRRRLVAA